MNVVLYQTLSGDQVMEVRCADYVSSVEMLEIDKIKWKILKAEIFSKTRRTSGDNIKVDLS
jgi:hypothetical protein